MRATIRLTSRIMFFGLAIGALVAAEALAQSSPPTLPGLMPPDVQLNLEPAPYNFQFGRWVKGAGFLSRCGQRYDAATAADLSVCFYSPTTSNVSWVEIAISGASIGAAEWLLPHMATLPFTGNDQQASYDWATASWRKATVQGRVFTRKVAGVTMEIYGVGGTSIFLDITPDDLEAWLLAHPPN